jgi:SHS2 domain-containing protein
MKRYRVFDHTADLGVEIFGETEAGLFENAAYALYDLMADLRTVAAKETRTLSVEGTDREDLLINYLREALYLFNGEQWLLKKVAIHEIGEDRLSAEAQGETFDPARHNMKREIKAVTYHRAEVRKTSAGWSARVIFDV